MRTKSLCLAAAALLGGVWVSSAQSNVYSLNIVGYVNRPLQGNGQYSLVSNPLNTTNNTYAGLLQGLPVGWSVTKWTGSGFSPAAGRVGFGNGWTPTTASTNTFNPGEAVFIKSATGGSPYTNTFVGEVMIGSFTNNLPAGFSMIGNPIADAGSVTNLNLIPPTGSQILVWKEDGVGGYTTYGKVGFGSGWTPSVPSLNVGQGFFINAATPYSWVRSFNP
ncbi:MAG TPA: hypothetical protein VFV96_09105 [Verrucomicrobiae bacterium]|nr:hypothetical protein [Verrucomicrobiae bacterium]